MVQLKTVQNMADSDIDREAGTPVVPEKYRIAIDLKGPYLVYGNPPIRQMFMIRNEKGIPRHYRIGVKDYDTGNEPVSLCRCGSSGKMPYCDGSHAHAEWDPELTAPFQRVLADADLIEGPALELTDNENYCAYARFCDANGRVWNLVRKSADEQDRETAIRDTAHCPSGRLKIWDKLTGKTIEPDLKPGIGLIEDLPLKVSGSLWVRGGIPVLLPNGQAYEVRNRVTLCRCGMSANKPFCNGAHASVRFRDGLPEEMTDEEE